MAKAATQAQKPAEDDKKTETQELVKQDVGTLPAELMNQFDEDAGKGQEKVTAADLAIPFLVILQDNSPQVKRGHAKRIDGAEAGMILNTLTGELFNEIEVIPCFFDKVAIEWTDRDSGGGLVAIHPMETELWKETAPNPKGHGAPILPKREKHLLVETAQFYVIGFGSRGRSQAVIAMASTQLKKNRQWNATIAGIKLVRKDGSEYNPPMFSHRYKLSTALETKDTNSWYGWKIELLGPVQTVAQYSEAKAFYEAANKGLVTTRVQDLAAVGDAAADGANTAGLASDGKSDDKIAY